MPNTWVSGTNRNVDGRLYFTGGGHSDYAGNELYYVDAVSSPPIVNRYNNPALPSFGDCGSQQYGIGTLAGGTHCNNICSSGAGVAAPGQTTTGCTPSSRHTYDGLVYIPPGEPYAPDSLVLWNGCAGGPQSCGYGQDLWTFSFSTNTWTLRGTFPGAGGGMEYPDAIAYNTADHRVYIYTPTANSIWGYIDPATWTYTSISAINADTSVYNYWHGVIDPVHSYMVMTGAAKLYKLPLTGGSATEVTASCSGLVAALNGHDAVGVVWDSALKTIVIWPSSGNTTWDYNPATNTCTSTTWTGATVATSSGSPGTFGKFAYVPSKNIYILLAGSDTDPMVLCRSANGCP